MRRHLLVLGGSATVLLAAQAAALAPQPRSSPAARADTSAADARKLFTGLRGTWSCTGAFADGRKLAADLAFEPLLGGRTLRYRHVDRAPSAFVHEAQWGVDGAHPRIVSLAFAGVGAEQPASPALFVATAWTARTITLEADTLVAPPWAPNRFTYTLQDDGTLRMVWEVRRGAAWQMGDYLDCTRAVRKP